jgi:hypothetical protein
MGIFAIEGDGTARKVIRTGDLASFGPGDLRPLIGISLYTGSLTELPGMAQLSDTGYLAFWAHTSDANAIVVANLPEPGVGAGLAAGMVVLAVLHKASRRRAPA